MKKNNSLLPEKFNWRTYIKLNSDLKQNLTKQEAINHFIYHGKKEQRKYSIDFPKDFNWRGYIYLNRDLVELNTKVDCIKHYLKYGYFENRKYEIELPDDFNWESYLEYNPELNGEITDENKASIHYLKKGFFENRKYSKIIDITRELNTLPAYYLNETIEKNNIDIISDNTLLYEELHENELLKTRVFNFNEERFEKNIINEDIINILKEFVLVIDFQNGGGGTTFFLNTIISKYKKYQTFLIVRNINGLVYLNINEEYKINKNYDIHESIDLLENIKPRISKIFINHLIGHNPIFIEKLFSLNKEVIGITHDYYNLTIKPQPFYHEIEDFIKLEKHVIDINKYSHIITQNIKNLNIFKKYYKNKVSVVPLPDYLCCETEKYNYINPPFSKIVVGIIGNIIDIKGKKILEEILTFYKDNQNIEIVVIGYTTIKNFKNYISYDSIEEFNNIIIRKKVNVLLELSLWPETYSYTLTLAIKTDLPIIYLEKKFYSVVRNRLSTHSKVYTFSTIQELDTLIKNYNQNYFYKIKPIVYYSKFWNDLFITKKQKIQNIQQPIHNIKSTQNEEVRKYNFRNSIKPYFIYFPQFHNIKENNLLFYENYNDAINLQEYNKHSPIKLEQLDCNYLNIPTLKHYDTTNTNIIQKQINLIDDYGFDGIAMYYYWFSNNNITNENMIMEKTINKFFHEKINMKNQKIFFIWANENWTSNNAFGINNKYKIENVYNNDNFQKNAEKLIAYFKHENYLKIENKPVFFIYHNFLIEENNIDNFFEILNKLCFDNGFYGIHLVLNSFEQESNKYQNFYINFNYKKSDCRYYDEKEKQIKLNYKKYINDSKHINEKKIQTIVYDFNNRPRLFKPDRLEHSTVCVENTEFDKIIFTEKIVNTYVSEKTSELENILLVNSLNEWGENMTFEPSDKYGYCNMNTLFNCLICE